MDDQDQEPHIVATPRFRRLAEDVFAKQMIVRPCPSLKVFDSLVVVHSAGGGGCMAQMPVGNIL